MLTQTSGQLNFLVSVSIWVFDFQQCVSQTDDGCSQFYYFYCKHVISLPPPPELYSYTEGPEFILNRKCFEEDFRTHGKICKRLQRKQTSKTIIMIIQINVSSFLSQYQINGGQNQTLFITEHMPCACWMDQRLQPVRRDSRLLERYSILHRVWTQTLILIHIHTPTHTDRKVLGHSD